MSNLMKKIVAIATGLTLATMLFPVVPVQALTAAELQTQINDLLATLAGLQDQLTALTGEPATTGGAIVGVPADFTFSKALYAGMSATDVKYLQIVLNSNAATKLAASGAGSPGSETLYFGPITKAAVIKFQELYASEVLASWGLTKGTGYVGQTTRDKLNSLLETAAGEEPADDEEPADGEEPVVTGDGLTVAFASDNPGATTIVSDSTGEATDSAQSMIPFLKVKLTNGDASAVKVTQINFKRSGIAADADLSQAYLCEGDTVLAEYESFSSAVLVFSSSAGLVTIPAGSSKTITLKADLANDTTAGKTIRFSIDSSSDVVSDASVVSGSFGLVGNYMSTAVTTDVGQLTVSTTTAAGGTVDPQDGLEVYNLNLAGADQKLEVRKIKFTNIGSTAASDLANFKLYDGGTQIGNTIENMDAAKTITFDLTDSALVIDKGITKNLHLRADIVSGTNRTFQFSIQEITDISVYDTGYGIYVKPNKLDSWTVFQMTASTINTGKLTMTRSASSPSTNVALGATNVTVAEFDLKATGEAAKITTMVVRVYGTVSTDDLYQGKIYFDGSQKSTTDTILVSNDTDVITGENSFTFGNTFIVPADGATHSLKIIADIKKGDGTAYSGSENFTIKISSVTAVGKTSLATVSVGTVTGHQLTITSGTLSAAKNETYPNWSSSLSTGVAGATEALVGSFVVTAGASEGADITSVKVRYSTTTNSILQNMKLYSGTKETGTQIGSTLGTFSASESDGTNEYTFYPSPYISLAAGTQFVLNVYADILTGAPSAYQGTTTLCEVNGVGKVTASSINYQTDADGQDIYIAGAGTMALIEDSSSPVSDIVIMGATEQSFAVFKYSASTSAENIKITSIVATTTVNRNADIKNIKLVGNGLNASIASLNSSGVATFNLASNPWIITAGTEEKLTIKADIGTYGSAVSGDTVLFAIATTTYEGAISGGSTSTVAAVSLKEAGGTMKIYRTRPTVTFVGPTAAGTLTDGTKTLLEFKITANAAQDVNLYSINLGVVLSDTATATDLYIDDITLYDKADLNTALSTYVSTSTDSGDYGTGVVTASSDFGKEGGVNALSSASGDIELFDAAATSTLAVMDIIPAGTTVTYVVKATVVGSAQYDSIIMRLADFSTDDNALRWGDQTLNTCDSDYIKTVPTDYSSMNHL